MVLKKSQNVCGEWRERRWRGGGHTECAGVREHIPGSIAVDMLRRIEVRACG